MGALSGGAWVPCGSCSKMPASVMGANDDMAKQTYELLAQVN